MKTMEQRISDLKNVCEIQCRKGTYDYDEYMRGMANGLILAVAIMEDTSPVYFEAPDKIHLRSLRMIQIPNDEVVDSKTEHN